MPASKPILISRRREASPFLLLAASFAALPASAQSLPPDAVALQQVVVTGTRRVDRTLAQSESPVDVISAADLQRGGSAELATALA
ncbi:MAG TPA: hypothetical protein VK195_05785, partial [Burkholderiaceae bacterium]|nr:hypothetical protein [Burkholderiaceae bacterium]